MNQEDLLCGYDVIYLAACALHGLVPDKKVMDAMDRETVYKMAEYHSLTAITYYAVERYLKTTDAADWAADGTLLAKWKEARNKAIRKIILFDAEREKLLAFMEEKQIWYMPLKGVLLKDLYPIMGMRQMADNDILFDEKHRQTLHDYMLDNQFTAVDIGEGYHDTYQKAPFYNFEMHIALFDEKCKQEFKGYYENVKARLIKDEGNGYGYHFRDEDFYIYLVAHSYKHFYVAGNGIRSLLDVYVYLQKRQNRFDRVYLDGELAKLGIQAFESAGRALAEKLFGKPVEAWGQKLDQLSDGERQMLEIYLGAGTYGSMDGIVANRMNKVTGETGEVTGVSKWKYFWRRVFPDMEYYRMLVPFVYKHRLLIPLYVVYRGIKGLLFKSKELVKEFRMVWKYKK